MIYQNMELFNLRAVEDDPAGVRLCRLPAAVRNQLNPRARMQGLNANCGEIRFVTDAPFFTVRLMARKLNTWPQPINPQMRVMCGNLEYSRVELPFDRMTAVPFDAFVPAGVRPEVLRPDPEFGFASNVWRLVLPGPEIVFGGIETFGFELRPPTREETPKYRILCHGSSITDSYIEGWPPLLGHYLGVDVLNLGLAGACQVEDKLADYLATLDEYDALILELGINIIGTECSEFARRVDYFLAKLAKAGRPVALITVFPSFDDFACQTDEKRQQNTEKPDYYGLYRQIIRDAADQYRNRGFDITVVEGPEIDVPSKCWSYDLLHPRYLGNSFMAYKLGDILRQKWSFLR